MDLGGLEDPLALVKRSPEHCPLVEMAVARAIDIQFVSAASPFLWPRFLVFALLFIQRDYSSKVAVSHSRCRATIPGHGKFPASGTLRAGSCPESLYDGKPC